MPDRLSRDWLTDRGGLQATHSNQATVAAAESGSDAFAWGQVCGGLALVSIGAVLPLVYLGLFWFTPISFPDVQSPLLGGLLLALAAGGPLLFAAGVCLCSAAPPASRGAGWAT